MTKDLDPRPVHPFAALRRFTEARIALGRHGAGLPTAARLDFAEAHARARDAVHAAFDVAGVAARLAEKGLPPLLADSLAADRATYLRRPDLGRRLSDAARLRLEGAGQDGPFDLALVVGDGLSARAANLSGAETALAVLSLVPRHWRIAPPVLATGARVALSDPIGEALGARLVLMLIGERPGLSASDSLGAYLTFGPRTGTTDADRNCVSNIRAGGLPPPLAAATLARLLVRAAALGFTGTRLKDDDGAVLDGRAAPVVLVPPAVETAPLQTK